MAISRDVTDRKAYERQLERQNERLNEFASVVSHDLRNPLNVAEGRLELVREECDSEHLDAILTAHDRMERIIDDVLWLAREGRDIGDTEPVDFGDAIEAAWSIVADGRDGIELIGPESEEGRPVTISADDDRLRQLLENLFRNAVDHGGPRVAVRVELIEEGFAVEDDGPGIPRSERERAFEAGYSTADEGTGFGLRIVDRVAEAHGWKVRVTDGVDGGARFEVTGVEFV